MKRLLPALMAMGLSVFPATAQTQKPYMVQTYGAGLESCATWLSNPGEEASGSNWVLGYWSGRNIDNAQNHLVGSHTDGQGVLGEVKVICTAEPSTELADAVARTYFKMEREGK